MAVVHRLPAEPVVLPASRMPVLDAENVPPGRLSLLGALHWPHSVSSSTCYSHRGEAGLGQAGVRALSHTQ